MAFTITGGRVQARMLRVFGEPPAAAGARALPEAPPQALVLHDLLAAVEAHLELTRIAASRFGMEAVGDPNFVRNLRAGREPRRRVVERVKATIQEQQARAAAQQAESVAA